MFTDDELSDWARDWQRAVDAPAHALSENEVTEAWRPATAFLDRSAEREEDA